MIILGCGYLGTALARKTLAAGGPVSALTRNAGRAAELRALGVAPVVVAALASEDWHGLLNPAGEVIVNCVSPAGSGAEGYRHSFVEGGKSVAHWLEKSAKSGHAPAREALFTSSTGVYPQMDGEWVNEATPEDPAALSEAGTILREAEKSWHALPRPQVQRTWVLRLGGLYGPGRHHLLDALRAGEKTFPGGGEHWVNLLYLDDAASAIRACLAASPKIPGGIFNAVDDEPVRKRDLLIWLAEQLGQNSCELKFDVTNSPRASHRRSVSGRTPHRRVSSFYLKQSVNWRPLFSSYREGYGKILALKWD